MVDITARCRSTLPTQGRNRVCSHGQRAHCGAAAARRQLGSLDDGGSSHTRRCSHRRRAPAAAPPPPGGSWAPTMPARGAAPVGCAPTAAPLVLARGAPTLPAAPGAIGPPGPACGGNCTPLLSHSAAPVVIASTVAAMRLAYAPCSRPQQGVLGSASGPPILSGAAHSGQLLCQCS